MFVVGGRSFTSLVMQRNCHEFIAYENLVGSRRGSDKRQSGPVTQSPIDQVLPLVRRALKVLSDREVTPQLGLLKSTLLQLDSTFSERTYGVNSFRDFAQKLASAGHVTLREHGRNVLVEQRDGGTPLQTEDARNDNRGRREAADVDAPRFDVSPQEPRAADGIREIRRIFQNATTPPRWPMYIRQAKQFMRNVEPSFDERKFGFGSLVDLLRAAQREGLFRMERDRQGSVRLFPGPAMQTPSVRPPVDDDDNRGNIAEPGNVQETDEAAGEAWMPEAVPSRSDESEIQSEVVEGAVVQELDVAPVVDAEELPQEQASSSEQPSRGRRPSRSGRAPRKPQEAGATRARKAPSPKPRAARAPRSRKDAPQ